MPEPVEPFDLALAKLRLRIVANDRDSEIEQLLLAARHHIEHHCEQVLTTPREVTEAFSAFTRAPMRLRTRPIVSVVGIDYLDTDGAPATVAADDIRLLADGRGVALIPMPALSAWPSSYHLGTAVTVNLTAGYAAKGGDGDDATWPNVPPELVTAMLLLVRHWFDNPSAVIVGTIASELPLGVKALCRFHRLAY